MASVCYETDKLEKLLSEINQNHAAYVRIPGTDASRVYFDLNLAIQWAKDEEIKSIYITTEEMKFLEGFGGQG